MASKRQVLGERGERLVVQGSACPRCKRTRTLRQLRANFKCADVICDFCGFLAQVKTRRQKDIGSLPSRILGAAWRPMKERLDAGIYFPLFVVLVADEGHDYSVWYLSADLQTPEMFVERKPLSPNAQRSGWQGFIYDLAEVESRFVRMR
jgi:hypothetical protein